MEIISLQNVTEKFKLRNSSKMASQEDSKNLNTLQLEQLRQSAPLANVSNVFMLSQHKNKKHHNKKKKRNRARRDSHMYLVDGQRLAWSEEPVFDNSHLNLFKRRQSSSVPSSNLGTGSSLDLNNLLLISSGSPESSAAPTSEEVTSHRIRWCRESITQLKRQTWPMERKLQTLRACKSFIKQHQGELTQSNQARDLLASVSVLLDHYWRLFKRELANFLVIITPWEMRIKKIESHFGSVVASYFTFLRWIFWLNLANSLVLICFVLVPELIENEPDPSGMRKGQLGMVGQPLSDFENAINESLDGTQNEHLFLRKRPDFNPTLVEIIEFEGFLKYSPIFYGFYSNREQSRWKFWRNPLAYLLSIMLTYLLCVFCISRKLSQNNKLSRAGAKEEEYIFSWTVFVGWDFMIGNAETAYNKTSSLVMNLKERILEEKEQVKDRDWRLFLRRVLANVISVMLIVSSAFVVGFAVQRSENLPDDANLLQKNELQLVMSGIQFIFPPLFDVIGFMECYHPRKALNWQLGRILSLDFLNFYTLMFALIGSVGQMGHQLNEVSNNMTLMRYNSTHFQRIQLAKSLSMSLPTTTTTTLYNNTNIIQDLTTTTTTTTTTTRMIVPVMSSELSELMRNETSKNMSLMAQNVSTYFNYTSTTTIQPILNITMPSPAEITTMPILNVSNMASSKQLSIDRNDTMNLANNSEIIDSDADDYLDFNVNAQKPTSSSNKRHADDESEIEMPVAITEKNSQKLQRPSAGLPAIRDPYKSLGAHSKSTQKLSDEAATAEVSSNEEPLEGRLELDRERNEELTTQTSTVETTIYEDPITIAIPATTSGSVQMISSTAMPNVKINTTQEETTITVTDTIIISNETNENSTQIIDAKMIQPEEFKKLFNISLDLAENHTSKLISAYDDPQGCAHIPKFDNAEILALNETFREKLQLLCWETMFGQEMVKIVVTDLVMTIISAIAFEFLRACFVRYCNRFFFWDLERGLPGYQDFKIAENVLHLVNNQSTVWMGMFFAPGLPAINTIKLAVLMYVRSWAVLTCNIPHETVFKVSKSNNFYYLILLLNLIICIMPVAYAVTWIRPSWHCGPFGGQCRMYVVLTKLMETMLPPEVNAVVKYLSSPGTIIPLIILLILIIYYLTSTLGATKESNKDLKTQLKKNKDDESVPEIRNSTIATIPDDSLAQQTAATLNPLNDPLIEAAAAKIGLDPGQQLNDSASR